MSVKTMLLCVLVACGMHEMQAMQGNNQNRQPVPCILVAHSQSIPHATYRVVQASSTQGNAQQKVQELEKTVKELTAKIAILEEEKMKILYREKRIDSLMTNTILLKPNGECWYSREELRECVYL